MKQVIMNGSPDFMEAIEQIWNGKTIDYEDCKIILAKEGLTREERHFLRHVLNNMMDQAIEQKRVLKILQMEIAREQRKKVAKAQKTSCPQLTETQKGLINLIKKTGANGISMQFLIDIGYTWEDMFELGQSQLVSSRKEGGQTILFINENADEEIDKDLDVTLDEAIADALASNYTDLD